jgi:putative acetyltransferase
MQRDRDVRVVSVSTPAEMAPVRTIFSEYALALGIDLSFQNFDAELDNLPGEYIAPLGGLLLALVDGDIAGCCALRPLVAADHVNAAEMKRLYVRPGYRRLGVGRLLAEATLDSARVAGYHSVLLDTLSDMEAARALYAELGFYDIPPFYYNPVLGAHYLKADL